MKAWKWTTLAVAAIAPAAISLISVPAMAQDPLHPATKIQTDHEMNAQEKKNLQLVLDWWRIVVQSGHVEDMPKYAREDMIQHNPNAPNGLEPLRKAFASRRKDPVPKTLSDPPVVTFAKGDYVTLVLQHEEKDPADPSKTYFYNSFDVFRIENGKIAEHWDSAFKAAPRAN